MRTGATHQTPDHDADPPGEAMSAQPMRENRALAGVRDNLRHARLNRREIAGSLGDMGTFLPLLLRTASQNGLSFVLGCSLAWCLRVGPFRKEK